MPAVTALQEAEARSHVQAQPGHLSDIARACLEIKKHLECNSVKRSSGCPPLGERIKIDLVHS